MAPKKTTSSAPKRDSRGEEKIDPEQVIESIITEAKSTYAEEHNGSRHLNRSPKNDYRYHETILAGLLDFASDFNGKKELYGDQWVPVAEKLSAAINRAISSSADDDSRTAYRRLAKPPPRRKFEMTTKSIGGGAGAMYGVYMAMLSRLGDEAKAMMMGTSSHGKGPSKTRPKLSTKVSRFHPGWDDVQASDSLKVREARCEVISTSTPSSGRVYAGQGLLAFGGGGGYKDRDSYAEVYDIRNEATNKWSGVPKTGEVNHRWQPRFYEPVNNVYVANDLVWMSGDRRIRAFNRNGKMQHTLYKGETGGYMTAVGNKFYVPADDKTIGTLLVWDINALPVMEEEYEFYDMDPDDEPITHAEDGTEFLNLAQDCWMDEDGLEGVEVTKGVGHTDTLTFQSMKYSIDSMAMLQNDSQVVLGSIENACLSVFDWGTQELVSLLTGHELSVRDLSTAAEEPALLLTASWDWTSRLYDVRTGAASIVLDNSKSEFMSACALAVDGGSLYAFTSGNESVHCWDLRNAGKPLYELSTGNMAVISLSWDSDSCSLFASGEYTYMDRLGGRYERGTCQGYEWVNAAHKPKDFLYAWDQNDHAIIRYAFKDAPDLSVLPSEEAEPADADSECESDTFKPNEDGDDFW